MRFNTEDDCLRGQSNRYLKYNGTTGTLYCTVQYSTYSERVRTFIALHIAIDGCVRKHCDRCCCCCKSDNPFSSGVDATATTAITDTATNILRHRSPRGASEPARGIVHGWVYLLYREHSAAGGSSRGIQPLGTADQGRKQEHRVMVVPRYCSAASMLCYAML